MVNTLCHCALPKCSSLHLGKSTWNTLPVVVQSWLCFKRSPPRLQGKSAEFMQGRFKAAQRMLCFLLHVSEAPRSKLNYVKIPLSRVFYLVRLAFTLLLWLTITNVCIWCWRSISFATAVSPLLISVLSWSWLWLVLWGWVWFMEGWQPILSGDSEHEQVLEMPSGLWQLSCY